MKERSIHFRVLSFVSAKSRAPEDSEWQLTKWGSNFPIRTSPGHNKVLNRPRKTLANVPHEEMAVHLTSRTSALRSSFDVIACICSQPQAQPLGMGNGILICHIHAMAPVPDFISPLKIHLLNFDEWSQPWIIWLVGGLIDLEDAQF